jgi:hypothetical protein
VVFEAIFSVLNPDGAEPVNHATPRSFKLGKARNRIKKLPLRIGRAGGSIVAKDSHAGGGMSGECSVKCLLHSQIIREVKGEPVIGKGPLEADGVLPGCHWLQQDINAVVNSPVRPG